MKIKYIKLPCFNRGWNNTGLLKDQQIQRQRIVILLTQIITTQNHDRFRSEL